MDGHGHFQPGFCPASRHGRPAGLEKMPRLSGCTLAPNRAGYSCANCSKRCGPRFTAAVLAGEQGRCLRQKRQQRWYQSWAGSQGCKEKTKARDDASIRLFARASAIFSGLIGQKPLAINTLADIFEGLQVQPGRKPRRTLPSPFTLPFTKSCHATPFFPCCAAVEPLPPAARRYPRSGSLALKPSRRPCSGVFRMTCPWRCCLQLSLAQPVLTLHPQPESKSRPCCKRRCPARAGQGVHRSGRLRCTLVFDAATASVRTGPAGASAAMRLDGAPEALAQMFSAYSPYHGQNTCCKTGRCTP